MVLSAGRCSIHAFPSWPARAAAQGSLNRRSSRALSFARTAAVQWAVDPKGLGMVFSDMLPPNLDKPAFGKQGLNHKDTKAQSFYLFFFVSLCLCG
jgi:hypothetical protein